MRKAYSMQAGVLLACCVIHASAFAQGAYPIKPIRLVHGFTPGGISDVLARAIGAKLSDSLGQQVVVDPRPGAGTTIASDLIAKPRCRLGTLIPASRANSAGDGVSSSTVTVCGIS